MPRKPSQWRILAHGFFGWLLFPFRYLDFDPAAFAPCWQDWKPLLHLVSEAGPVSGVSRRRLAGDDCLQVGEEPGLVLHWVRGSGMRAFLPGSEEVGFEAASRKKLSLMGKKGRCAARNTIGTDARTSYLI